MSNIFDLFKQIEKTDVRTVEPISQIIVGLGNPGDKYRNNRHNAGFMFMDLLAEKLGVKIDRLKFKSLVGEAMLGGRRVLLMKPQTFMNNSGEAVREAADFYKISPENILVVYDDINLEPGKLRIRRKGSDGGHNGIKSIIYHLEANSFPRIKLGVGNKPRPDYDLAAWVLADIPKEKREAFFDSLCCSYEAAELILAGKTDDAMGKYN